MDIQRFKYVHRSKLMFLHYTHDLYLKTSRPMPEFLEIRTFDYKSYYSRNALRSKLLNFKI